MYQHRIVIVGAGIIGLSTAYALLKSGQEHVTLLEQATVDHPRAASHGVSRLLRFEYGADLFYSEMVRLSLMRWRDLEFSSGRTLYSPTGLLVLGNEDDDFTRSSYHVLHEMGISPQYLSQDFCTSLFPQFNTQSFDLLTYNAEAGILHASTCLQTLRKLILALGGSILENSRVSHFSHDYRYPLRIRLTSGNELVADRLVLATGPWVHSLLGDLCLPVRLTRQYLLYFSNLSATSFSLPAFPSFMADDLYGFPIHSAGSPSDAGWLKAASHSFGVPVEPDNDSQVDHLVIAQVTRRLRDLIPALQYASLARVESCIYDVSLDEDFILDFLPGDSRVAFATGLTGHAFKFGPLLGELLASMVSEKEPAVPLERFRLARFSPLAHTQVHSVA